MKKQRKFHLRYFLIFFLILFLLFLINKTVRPIVITAIKYEIEEQATQIINSSILSILEEERDIINNSVKIKYSSDEKITSITADNYIFNFLKERIFKSISNSLEKQESNIKIPIFSFIGIPFLSSCGPEIPIKIATTSIPRSDISGTLKTNGINQNIYTVILTYSVQISSIIPFFTVDAVVSDNFILTEIVFTGEIPQIALNQ